MKSQYPDSEQIKYFEPQIEKLKAYLKSNAEKYDQARVIETNYISINDLLETFKGKNVLIDIWATWCGPCVEDFNYKSALKPFIENGKLTVLYISIDKQTWEKKWRENIRFNQLEGYHVLADDVLIRDAWHYLGGREGVIPRYALIDKNGNVFLAEAARPSQGKKLVEQVENLLAQE
jgi:thiol-disulfide isomerase/thioredoxin